MTTLLHFAWSMFIRFAKECGALNGKKAEDLSNHGWDALYRLGARQADKLRTEDPALRFVSIINALLLGGKVGFRESLPDESQRHIPIGERDGDFVNLIPTATWHVVKEYCRAEGTNWLISPRAVNKSLKARGWIITDPQDNHMEVRRVVFGRQQRVLRMPMKLFDGTGDDEGE
jgi:hypothetical protein